MSLVHNKQLAKLSKELGFDKYILTSKTEVHARAYTHTHTHTHTYTHTHTLALAHILPSSLRMSSYPANC